MTRIRKKEIIATILLLLFLGVIAFYGTRKPTRSECMTGYKLDWSSVKDPHEIRNSLNLPHGKQRIEPLIALSISDDGKFFYLLFWHDCRRKWQMSNNLIDYWRSEGLDLPKIEAIQEEIIPSTSTIEVKGAYWRDSP